ncbi:MAG: hypothetical protein HYT62_02455 [Candidatus Yanofskybacteria bacterium]|nr:hypothetical protein [Candidatus Yanofskybacteria bacterium]
MKNFLIVLIISIVISSLGLILGFSSALDSTPDLVWYLLIYGIPSVFIGAAYYHYLLRSRSLWRGLGLIVLAIFLTYQIQTLGFYEYGHMTFIFNILGIRFEGWDGLGVIGLMVSWAIGATIAALLVALINRVIHSEK